MKIIWLSLLILTSQSYAQKFSESDLKKKADQAAMKLGGSLKTQLMQKMAQAGPIAALEFCSLQAPHLANEVNKNLPKGWIVSRVSDKTRNKKNQMDELDSEVFLKLKSSKESSYWVSRKDPNSSLEGRRYYKAIRIEATCLRCHGTSIEENLAKVIQEKYPEDQATGYKVGDLRGLFKVIIPDSSN